MPIKLLPANQLDSLTKFSADSCNRGVLNVFHMGFKLLADILIQEGPVSVAEVLIDLRGACDELLGQL